MKRGYDRQEAIPTGSMNWHNLGQQDRARYSRMNLRPLDVHPMKQTPLTIPQTSFAELVLTRQQWLVQGDSFDHIVPRSMRDGSMGQCQTLVIAW